MKNKILALIPARGGSKGLPRKNIKPLLGKPLIAWTIEQAKNSKYVDKVVVSTDDEEIAEISRKYGAEVPFLRPKELARDDSPTIDTIMHATNWFEERGEIFDIIVLLQPTSPLKTTEDIDNAIELFLNNKNALSLVSVKENEHPPFWSFKIENDYIKPLFGNEYINKRRQELPKCHIPNGAIFISYIKVLKEYRTFYTPKTISYIMPPERSVDIDNEFDFLLAEFILKK
ncbi:acylneuraminate cytidylyltransferase [Methanococcus aeolicus Nankai-3]|uniref:Acylneuraminate cytidylyltransferase n=1 Tax=Methanococcus aeolicus (strain ATCC BAA-1280 / DSM 17508 / OCM 812 / Nankai-3) TaxID=419665 RepID=A6UU31_META3|nr:acylneuraminate cytidylyltransferase family protein [Methanococcus aeolicus]ABR56003.1 acylneuraminate cytidylyltransferase [Methanococcus aeolicus Nankai-3]